MIEQGYDFYLADTDAGKNIHYSLRYQVYCLREQFEDPSAYPHALEQDEYDDTSAHFLVRSRLTGEWLGAMRLIVAPAQKLPVSKFSSLSPANYSHLGRRRAAEASRLCTLIPSHGKRAVGRCLNVAPAPRAERITSFVYPLQTSWVAIGLIGAARQYCLRHGILHCFFLISDPLARMLRRLGMEIEPIGSPCLHRGWRRPYLHNVKTGYRAMRQTFPELYEYFCRPTAYLRLSQWNETEILPLTACGGDRRLVGPTPALIGAARSAVEPREQRENPPLIPAVAGA